MYGAFLSVINLMNGGGGGGGAEVYFSSSFNVTCVIQILTTESWDNSPYTFQLLLLYTIQIYKFGRQ